jgi:hypothetical protein
MNKPTRREMFASTIAALVCGTNKAVAETPVRKDVPGFIVIHQHVGSLPPTTAEAMCERVKKRFTESPEWLEFKEKFPNWNFLMLPVRDHESYIEIYCEDEGGRKAIESIIMYTGVEVDPVLIEDTPELRQRAKDYVRIMLGAPAVTVELDDGQIDLCFETALKAIHNACHNIKEFTLLDAAIGQDQQFLMDGVLAYATIILSRMRALNSQHIAADNLGSPQFLYKEGKDQLDNWKSRLYPQRQDESA